MNVALWIVQVLLLAAFGAGGVLTLMAPYAELNRLMPYTVDLPETLMRFIAICEVFGAVGVILPALTRIRPALTPLAAMGLLTIMILAMGFHISRGEFSALPINLVLGGLAAFVAWGRSRQAPIAAHS